MDVSAKNKFLTAALAQEANGELFTVLDWLRWTVTLFERADLYYGHGTDNAWDEAVQLLQHVLSWPETLPRELMAARLLNSEKEHLLQCLEARINERKPLPYITHRAWFAGLSFYVDADVLIPRSPIAELIEQGFSPWVSTPIEHILDLCTGSACIGIACAAHLPEASVDCIDISKQALAIANKNVEYHEKSGTISTGQVNCIESDLWAALGKKAQGRYDVIVSNPPYVDAADMQALPEEYRHEPVLALAAGDDGLSIVRRILKEASQYLSSEGILVVEVGNSAEHLNAAFEQVPFTWLTFERGGSGVFVITRQTLLEHQDAF